LNSGRPWKNRSCELAESQKNVNDARWGEGTGPSGINKKRVSQGHKTIRKENRCGNPGKGFQQGEAFRGKTGGKKTGQRRGTLVRLLSIGGRLW